MESCHLINGVPTPLLSYGKCIGDNLDNVDYIVLVIPGNPGVIDYYMDFMKEVYDQLLEQNPEQVIPVWGISHAGHQGQAHQVPNIRENPNLFNLEGQIEHKLEFIKNYIPERIKLIGIGHSVGCKIWSELMRRDSQIHNQLFQCYMLFPTLERLEQTPNGQIIRRLFLIQWLILTILIPFPYLPEAFKTLMLKVCTLGSILSPCIIPGTLKFLNATSVECCIEMAKSECREIMELDVETLTKSVDKLFFYFASLDNWCPLEYVENLKMKLPKMRYKICDNGLEHTFVVHNTEMAKILSPIISEDLQSNKLC